MAQEHVPVGRPHLVHQRRSSNTPPLAIGGVGDGHLQRGHPHLVAHRHRSGGHPRPLRGNASIPVVSRDRESRSARRSPNGQRLVLFARRESRRRTARCRCCSSSGSRRRAKLAGAVLVGDRASLIHWPPNVLTTSVSARAPSRSSVAAMNGFSVEPGSYGSLSAGTPGARIRAGWPSPASRRPPDRARRCLPLGAHPRGRVAERALADLLQLVVDREHHACCPAPARARGAVGDRRAGRERRASSSSRPTRRAAAGRAPAQGRPTDAPLSSTRPTMRRVPSQKAYTRSMGRRRVYAAQRRSAPTSGAMNGRGSPPIARRVGRAPAYSAVDEERFSGAWPAPPSFSSRGATSSRTHLPALASGTPPTSRISPRGAGNGGGERWLPPRAPPASPCQKLHSRPHGESRRRRDHGNTGAPVGCDLGGAFAQQGAGGARKHLADPWAHACQPPVGVGASSARLEALRTSPSSRAAGHELSTGAARAPRSGGRVPGALRQMTPAAMRTKPREPQGDPLRPRAATAAAPGAKAGAARPRILLHSGLTMIARRYQVCPSG